MIIDFNKCFNGGSGGGSKITETDGILTDGTYEWYDKSKADLEIAESIEGLEHAMNDELDKKQDKLYADEQGLFTKEEGLITLTQSLEDDSNTNIFYVIDGDYSSMKMGNPKKTNEDTNYSIYDLGTAPDSYEFIQIEGSFSYDIGKYYFYGSYTDEEDIPFDGGNQKYHSIEFNKWYEYTTPSSFSTTAGTTDKSGQGKNIYFITKKDGDKYYGMLSTSNVIESSSNEYLAKFKTINGESVIGEGDIEIKGGSDIKITESEGIVTIDTGEGGGVVEKVINAIPDESTSSELYGVFEEVVEYEYCDAYYSTESRNVILVKPAWSNYTDDRGMQVASGRTLFGKEFGFTENRGTRIEFDVWYDLVEGTTGSAILLPGYSGHEDRTGTMYIVYDETTGTGKYKYSKTNNEVTIKEGGSGEIKVYTKDKVDELVGEGGGGGSKITEDGGILTDGTYDWYTKSKTDLEIAESIEGLERTMNDELDKKQDKLYADNKGLYMGEAPTEYTFEDETGTYTIYPNYYTVGLTADEVKANCVFTQVGDTIVGRYNGGELIYEIKGYPNAYRVGNYIVNGWGTYNYYSINGKYYVIDVDTPYDMAKNAKFPNRTRVFKLKEVSTEKEAIAVQSFTSSGSEWTFPTIMKGTDGNMYLFFYLDTRDILDAIMPKPYEYIPKDYVAKFKTINGESVLGEGDIEIHGGSSITETDGVLTDGTNEWYDKSKADLEIAESIEGLEHAMNDELDKKQDKLYADGEGIYSGPVEYTESDSISHEVIVSVGETSEKETWLHLSNEDSNISLGKIEVGNDGYSIIELNPHDGSTYFAQEGGTFKKNPPPTHISLPENKSVWVFVKDDNGNFTWWYSDSNLVGDKDYLSKFKTINGESVLGEGNIDIALSSDKNGIYEWKRDDEESYLQPIFIVSTDKKLKIKKSKENSGSEYDSTLSRFKDWPENNLYFTYNQTMDGYTHLSFEYDSKQIKFNSDTIKFDEIYVGRLDGVGSEKMKIDTQKKFWIFVELSNPEEPVFWFSEMNDGAKQYYTYLFNKTYLATNVKVEESGNVITINTDNKSYKVYDKDYIDLKLGDIETLLSRI